MSGLYAMAASRADLNRAIESAAPHLRPVLETVRDHRVGFCFLPQCEDPFRLPVDRKRPTITIVGDDFDVAVGPEGFHLPSIRRAIRCCDAFAVVSCGPLRSVYAGTAAGVAATRRNAMLIETRPEQEIAWVNLIREIAPDAPLCIATVEGGHA